jgi:subfamily B ATP-binding cassette protein MsbA
VATPLRRLTDVVGPISRGLASVERGLDLIDHAPRETGGGFKPEGRARGELSLRAVSMRFNEASESASSVVADRSKVDASEPLAGQSVGRASIERASIERDIIEGDSTELESIEPVAVDDAGIALADIDLEIHAGETIALVGPSGAGKSTLVNLLPRFLDPTSGTVALDGTPLPQWNLHALREQFALVSQEVVLFNDTVAANVCFGSAIDIHRAIAALAAANLGEFVDGLPKGIETMIGHNGTRLSGGQRQRMAIARAIYKDAPILILDEATSALDSESERLVQQALEVLMRGRTSIVIAHRLSTIERADRIIALDAGRVIEQGSHAQLIAHGGLYARLHALQFRS